MTTSNPTSKQMSPQLAGLVLRLQEWSRNCLIDGLKMDKVEPTLQALLREAYLTLMRSNGTSPVETTVLHEGVRQSYLKACELSLASGLLGDGDRSDLLELYKSLWPKAPPDIREKALMQPVEPK